ncbi:cupredoxin domain-containing protein [Candidatus Pacearchaeota archaeon]|nr:cupredoxin domain-containing protein [Candidatus Pacearchaeota archaeon]
MKKEWWTAGIILAVVLIAMGVYIELSENNILLNNTSVNFSSLENQNLDPLWQTYNISIRGFTFVPFLLKIKEGEKVIWINHDTQSHTVTSDVANQFSSGPISKEQSFEYVFKKKGVYEYHCAYYPYIKGRIIVEERK